MSSTTDILRSIQIDEQTGALCTPIYQTATFVQEAPGVNKGYDYARTGNPTREALEKTVAAIECGHKAFAFSSGLAAIDAVVKTLNHGDEILAVDDLYGGAYRLFTKVYEKLGISIRFVDSRYLDQVVDAISAKTKLIWIETPTNPTLKISDISAISSIAKASGVKLVVDNTFAGPLHQKPILLGADYVIHSGTKYLSGHSDLLAGLVVCSNSEQSDEIKFIQNASGAVLGPWESFLCLRGIQTLELRFARQSETALALAKTLSEHELIDAVHYPGLENHINHEVASTQQGSQFGGVLSFSFKEDFQEVAVQFLASLKEFKTAESLGGVRSLACLPSKMTHASVPREKRLQSDIQDSLVRLSCGIENTEDLLQDVRNGLKAISTYKEVVS